MPEPVFYTGTKPKITVGATPIDVTCLSSAVETGVDQNDNDYDTFCGGFGTVGPEKWTITITAYAAFGADGLWNQLRPLVGQTVPWSVLPYGDQPVSVDNPELSGTGILKAFPFLTGSAGEAAEITIEIKCSGIPTETTVPGGATQAADDEEELVEA